METNTKKENTDISYDESEDTQIKFKDQNSAGSKILHLESDVIKDIFNQEDIKTEDLESQEKTTSFVDVMQIEEIPLEHHTVGAQEVVSDSLVQEETAVEQMKFGSSDVPLVEDSSENRIPTPNINLVGQTTKRAFYVLKDIFGDIETQEDSENLKEADISEKNKLLCFFLTIIGGWFGLHRLYLGDFKRFIPYLIASTLYFLSVEILPDMGLANLVYYVMIFWIIADSLAIVFSKRIKDSKGKVLIRWY